jgi:hypothetical protein
MIGWVRKNLHAGQTIMFSSTEYDATNAIILHSQIALTQCIAVNQFDLPQVIQKMAVEKPSFVALQKDGPIFRQYGGEFLPDSITLGDIPLRLEARAGDFDIYIPDYD